MSHDIIIKTDGLSAGYGHNIVADDITFSVTPGEILVLIGPNGAGKSTILKTIAGQLSPIAGTVFLKGKDLADLPEKEIAREMSVMLTGRPGAELMSVWDMVSTGRYPYTGKLGILSDEDRVVVDRALEMTDMTEERDRQFEQISDGQKQRVMIARAICQEPEILVLDEPSSYLDIHHKLELIGILKKLARDDGIAVIMSLHELDLAQKCADHILCIREGKADRYGTPSEIFSHSERDYIRKLYELKKGTFIAEYGSIELERPEGAADIFVIGGGGCGIEVYRALQRAGKAFYAGVIHENDLDWPVASALAQEVVSARAFEAVSDKEYERASELMDKCSRVYCCISEFGEGNMRNRLLAEEAGKAGKLYGADQIWQEL